jgi:hypothetical protein
VIAHIGVLPVEELIGPGLSLVLARVWMMLRG